MRATEVDFLQALFCDYADTKNQAFEVICLNTSGEKTFRRWYPLCERAYNMAALDSRQYAGQFNVYISFLPRDFYKGDDKSVRQAHWLMTGIDGNSEGVDGAIGLLKSAVRWGKLPAPQILVNSGNGVHVYWRLSEVFVFDSPSDRELFSGVLRRIGQAIGGEKPRYGKKPVYPSVDKATPKQLPRFPLTYNHKSTPPKRVKFLRFDLDSETLTLPEWNRLLPSEPVSMPLDSPYRPRIGEGEEIALPPSIVSLVSIPHGEGGRNKALTRAVVSARKRGFGEDALQVLGMEFHRNNPGYRPSEIAQVIKWAVRNVLPAK